MSKELTSDLFQKAKDQVAKKNGFDSWKNLRFNAENFQGLDEIRSYNFYLEEAAELYASLQNAELQKEKLELIDMLDEARAQIEYMQEYTGPMGTCSTVLSRIESLIEKYTDKK